MTSRILDTSHIRVPLTPAQSKRLAALQQAAQQAAQLRDAVLSALIEGATDRDLTGWSVNIAEDAILLDRQGPAKVVHSHDDNGIVSDSQAGAMSP